VDIDGVMRGDHNTLDGAISLNSSIKASERMTRVVESSSRLRGGMGASMKMESHVFTNTSVDNLGREAKLSVLTNLDVNIGESNANKREEQEGVEHGGWQ